MPPDCGEKITLSITILLALTVFLPIITDYTPRSALSLPLVIIYFNINLLLVLMSVILTTIVVDFYYRGPKLKRAPRKFRKFVIGYVGQIFCFSHASRSFLHQQTDWNIESAYNLFNFRSHLN